MGKSRHIYRYQIPDSFNEETHFFYARGRITRRAFCLRLLLAIAMGVAFVLADETYVHPKYLQKLSSDAAGNPVIYDKYFLTTYTIFINFYHFVLPTLLFYYLLIQGIKRLHDADKNGWNLLWPLYNLILLGTKGTTGNNRFGLDPRPKKQVTYFDELKS